MILLQCRSEILCFYEYNNLGGVENMATISFDRNVVIKDPKVVADIESALRCEPKKISCEKIVVDNKKKEEIINKWFCR